LIVPKLNQEAMVISLKLAPNSVSTPSLQAQLVRRRHGEVGSRLGHVCQTKGQTYSDKKTKPFSTILPATASK